MICSSPTSLGRQMPRSGEVSSAASLVDPPEKRKHQCEASEPVSARNSATLRDLRIFVDHSAEPVTSNDLDLGCVGLRECS